MWHAPKQYAEQVENENGHFRQLISISALSDRFI
jgi:hypothetical protein